MADTPRINFAIAYAQYGAKAFPLHCILPDGQCSCGRGDCLNDPKGRGKHPLHTGWQEEATADRSALTRLWAKARNANIGVACGKDSNLTVVDIDGVEGLDQLHEFESRYGALPPAPRCLTGSGGVHLYFEYTEGPNNAVRWARGLDIRTEGGLVVGAGSRNAFGPYVFEAGYSLKDLPRAKMPAWLIDRIKEGQGSNGKRNRNGAGFKVPEQPVVEGEGRNNFLYRAGRSMKAKGFGPEAIRAALEAQNRASCKPPLGEDEFEAILKSVLTQGDSADFKGAQSAEAGSDNQSSESSGVEDDAWPDPSSLDVPLLPTVPTDTFPPAVGNMIDATAAETETPRELAVGMALGTLAAACQGKIVVRVKPGYTEQVNLWPIAPLNSGERKTAVQQRMTRPLAQWEREQVKEKKAEIAYALSERETALAQIQAMRTKAARLEPGSADFADASSRIADLEVALREVPHAPQVWAQDVTPERLGVLMADNNERMAIISDEGGIFEIMAGRYSRGIPNLDVFLQAHAGAPHRVDRGNRPPVLMQHPALTMVLSPQPEVLHGLAANQDFRGRGLLARFTYLLAASTLGYRNGEPPLVPESVSIAYEACIRRLLSIAPPESGPFVIELSEEARAEWRKYFSAVERDMRPDGRFEHMRDWAGKLPGMAARVAGLLHCAEHAFAADLTASKLSLNTMSRALDFACVCELHAMAAYDLMGADLALKAARKLWGWIERQRKVEFTFRNAFNALRGSFPRAAELDPAFEVLVERAYIAGKQMASRAGRPTRIYQVNPSLTMDWPKESA
jgi:hypothetical protein